MGTHSLLYLDDQDIYILVRRNGEEQMPLNPVPWNLEDEALRYAEIYTRVHRAVLNGPRRSYGSREKIPDGHSPECADRAATWFAGRLTDQHMTGAGPNTPLQGLNEVLGSSSLRDLEGSDAANA